MDIDDLARHVGAGPFRRACEQAVATATVTGRSLAADCGADGDLRVVPHELADLVEGDLGLAMELYRAMPCFANLLYVGHWAPRPELFAALRALLDEPDDAQAVPVAYWLWCTPFEEDEPRSARAWQAMLVDATERRSARLLDVSGPVPWSAKGPVLTSLADDPRWHPAIWRAVHAAVHDVLGRVDPAPASALLSRLGRPPDGIDAAGLRQRLAPDRSRRRPVRRGRGRRSGRDGRR